MSLLLHKANKELDIMIALDESGKVMPVIDRSFSLSEAAAAFRHFGEGLAKGKFAITMSDAS